MDLDILILEREKMERVWTQVRSYKGVKKSDVPSYGQCYVTALYLHKKYGGFVLKGRYGKFSHFWNKIDGEEFDLTSDQFGGDGLHPVEGLKPVIYHYPNFNNSRVKKFIKLMENIE